MYFECFAEQLLHLVQCVFGAVDKKKDNPILSNILLEVKDHRLFLVASDGELELMANLGNLIACESGRASVDAKKILDISRALPKTQVLIFKQKDNKIQISSRCSRFVLSTLPVSDYPMMQVMPDRIEFQIKSKTLVALLNDSHFSVAQNDVRFFLKGVLLKLDSKSLTFVSTDGHRLALARTQLQLDVSSPREIILPRKTALEILKFFSELEEMLLISISEAHLSIKADNFSMRSTLIESNYPDYRRIIPERSNKILLVDKDKIKEALLRVSVLTSDKYKGVRFQLRENTLNLIVLNLDQDIAEENLVVKYSGESFDIGFNIHYILDVLHHVPSGDLKIYIHSQDKPVLIVSKHLKKREFVVMPMRL